MADIEAEPPQSNGYANANDDDDDERGKMRPADIDAVSKRKIVSVEFRYVKYLIFGCLL